MRFSITVATGHEIRVTTAKNRDRARFSIDHLSAWLDKAQLYRLAEALLTAARLAEGAKGEPRL